MPFRSLLPRERHFIKQAIAEQSVAFSAIGDLYGELGLSRVLATALKSAANKHVYSNS